jgi:hypothetical protein
MPSGTTFNPVSVSDFDKTKLNFDAQGVQASVTAGSTQNIDYVLTDDCLMTGAWFLTNNSNYADSVAFQVIDTNGTYSGTPGTVLNQFITNWFLVPSVNTQFDMVYPAKIYAGLTLRVVYTSTGTSNPWVAVNYKLHKVLL